MLDAKQDKQQNNLLKSLLMKHSKGAKLFAWITIIILVSFTFLAYIAPAVPVQEDSPTEEISITEIPAEELTE